MTLTLFGHRLVDLIIADAFLCIVIVAMAYDLIRYRIPNVISLGLVLLFSVAALLAPGSVDWVSQIGAGVVVLCLAAVLFGFGVIGGGDVKLLAAISLWVGLPLLPLYLLTVATIGGALALALLLSRRTLALAEPLWLRSGIGIPRVLRPGEGVPYGIAIGAAALAVSPQLSLLAWP